MYLSDAYLGIYFSTRTQKSNDQLELNKYPEIRLCLYNDLNFTPLVVAKKGADYSRPIGEIPLRFMDWHVYEVKTSVSQNVVEIYITKSEPERTAEELILKGFDMATSVHRFTMDLNIQDTNPAADTSVTTLAVTGPYIEDHPYSKYTIYVTTIERYKHTKYLLGGGINIVYPRDFAKIRGAYQWITYNSVGQIVDIYIMLEDICESYVDDGYSDVKMKWKFKSIYAPDKGLTRKGIKKRKEKNKNDGT